MKYFYHTGVVHRCVNEPEPQCSSAEPRSVFIAFTTIYVIPAVNACMVRLQTNCRLTTLRDPVGTAMPTIVNPFYRKIGLILWVQSAVGHHVFS